jgi:hypothetical protein
MSRARLKEIMDPDETFMVPVGLGIVLDEIKVHAVGKGQSVCISVCPI